MTFISRGRPHDLMDILMQPDMRFITAVVTIWLHKYYRLTLIVNIIFYQKHITHGFPLQFEQDGNLDLVWVYLWWSHH